LGRIGITGDTFVATGAIGYDLAGEFSRKCHDFILAVGSRPAVMDLSSAEELVSPCLTTIYEECRTHRPAALTLRVPARTARLFAPGQAENLFRLETM
jgi:hypothetical protein